MNDWTTVVTVVFIAGMSVFNAAFLFVINQSGRFSTSELWGASTQAAEIDAGQEGIMYSAASASGGGSVDFEFISDTEAARLIIIGDAALLSANNPLSDIIPTREGVFIYKVQKGDTVTRIAANFGISVNTIAWANSNLRPNSLQPGQELVILPVTGVLHRIQENETLEEIASVYGIPAQRILSANPKLIPVKLISGLTIIIPDSRPLRGAELSAVASLPDFAGYFAIPTTGWNWGKLHNYNAVDIANACGTPVYAAAEGLITEVAAGWNEGYGNYVVIEHPNGAKTKYAHNQKNFVAVGDYVLKGDQIAAIGNTGLTHGPTGCHLHFEIRGAKNPFVR